MGAITRLPDWDRVAWHLWGQPKQKPKRLFHPNSTSELRLRSRMDSWRITS